MAPPFPIPNREVKHISANNTCFARNREDRSRPGDSKIERNKSRVIRQLAEAGFFVACEPGIVSSMAEGQSIHEREMAKPLANQINEIFERRATAGDRKLIMETYTQRFEQLIRTMPKEKQATAMIKIQRAIVKVSGAFYEYGARFSDFVRKIFLWPMVTSVEEFPKDKYYQMELARAKAWGEFAHDTTKTATAERLAYRDNFLPSALIGAEAVGALGTYMGAALGGVKVGTLAGAATGGLYGAGIGAVAGGILGGAMSLIMRANDRIMGPPVAYYNLNSVFSQGTSINIGTSGQTS